MSFPPPPLGHFILHSYVRPTMTAGHYELVTDQPDLPFSVAEEHTHVVVSSPRYTMPPEQILSSFPPANAEGAFGDRLPQIVLKRRTLPWERNPAGEPEVSLTPWLALVVVAEGEGELSTATPVAQCVTAGTALLDPGDKDVEQGLYLAVTETVVHKIFPCEQDLQYLTHVRHVDIRDTELAIGDDDGWLAVVLANRLPVFDTASSKPVRYLACLVNLEGQLGALPPPRPAVDFFEYELAQDWTAYQAALGQADLRVMGTVAELSPVAFPLDDGTPRAAAPHASGPIGRAKSAITGASLDGSAAMTEVSTATQWATATSAITAAAADPDARAMVRDQMGIGFRIPISVIAAEPVLRFPVLAHWSFTTTEGATFETLMQDLDVGLLGTLPETPPTVPAPSPVVATGHIDLGHRSRRGDAVRAWYRGPLVPYPTLREQPDAQGRLPVAHAADQLRRTVPDGREDLSLAAAFEIGRLLGLSQLSIVSALLRFRREQFGIGRVREILDRVTPFALPELLAERVDLGRFVALSVLDGLAADPEERFGPRRPVADPGRPLELRGELDEVIAGGLGFDLDAVRKAGDTVGVVAALATTDVPVAAVKGSQLGERAVADLRRNLEAEVLRTAGVALPTKIAGGIGGIGGVGGGRRGARAAAAPRAALDDLIAAAPTYADDDPEEP